MIFEKIPLSEKNPKATLTTYVFEDQPEFNPPRRRAVIVCPGGGYRCLSKREGEPIVSKFLGAGFNVFLLEYSIASKNLGYDPMLEAGRAIAHVRKNADRYHIMPDKIFITGFSAGGHLAASSGILWNCPAAQKEFSGEPIGINRPDGMILSYPVITAGPMAHQGSISALSISNYGKDVEDEWSLEKHVDSTTPPAFIWHTLTDEMVPVQNSLLLAEAMTEKNISYELHIYPKGPHGMALADEETEAGNPNMNSDHVRSWIPLAINWINIQ